MFDFLKIKNNKNCDLICAPIKGETVPSKEVSDPTFAEELLGKAIAIKPVEGKVYAPFDGEVLLMFETNHAVSLVSTKGAEILIHVGIDTILLKGEHYTAHIKSGSVIKKGDLLLEFDIDAIKTAGYEVIVPVVVCNSDDYRKITCITGKQVEPGEIIIKLEK